MVRFGTKQIIIHLLTVHNNVVLIAIIVLLDFVYAIKSGKKIIKVVSVLLAVQSLKILLLLIKILLLHLIYRFK